MKLNRIIKIAAGWLVTFIFLYLAFKKLSLNDILVTFELSDKKLLILSCTSFCLGYACRIERWRSMLIHENSKLDFNSCSWPLLISVAANNVLPLRAGDVIRMFAFNKKLNISATLSVSSLFVERLLDLITLLIFLSVALYYFNVAGIKEISYIQIIIPLFLIISLTAYIGLKSQRAIINKTISFAFMKFPVIKNSINDKLSLLYLFVDHVSSKLLFLKIICLSILAWFFEGLVFYFVAISLPNIKFPNASWLALTVGALSTTIPSSPGFIGTFDYFVSIAMKEFGNDQVASVAYAILLHFILWGLPVLATMIYYILSACKKFRNS